MTVLENIVSSKTSDFRNALLCGLAVVFAVALTDPISQSSFNDDWSYSLTVKHLYETGHLAYNGWASASLIAQVYWGLLWVKIFGYSNLVLRLSTLPLAAAAVSLCYLLGRRVGLIPHFAVFAALMVGLSPLYLPVASSFMTDAPGLFCIFLSMYLLARAMESKAMGTAMGWMLAGMLVGLVGGTGRQIVWVVPLVILPYAAWIRRGNLPFVIASLLAWAMVFSGALLTLRWFSHQPYSIPETKMSTDLRLAIHKPAHFVLTVMAIPLTTIWVILPALWGIGRSWRGNRPLIALLILIGPIMGVILMRHRYAMAPWIGNTLSNKGVMGSAELAGDRPVAMPVPVRIASGIAVFIVFSLLAADVLVQLDRPLSVLKKTARFFLFPESDNALLPAMTLFVAAYMLLLVPRSATNMTYDRYMLPIMPCALFLLLLKYQRQGDRTVPAISWALFALYTYYAIGITQEVTALGRAREEAANRLLAAGVQRTQIDAGFEYDLQTQIFAKGYINDPRIINPRGAFNKLLGPTYSVQALYRLEFQPVGGMLETAFGSVSYFSLIPPFHRRIFIDKFADAWWLDPRRAATQPADNRHRLILVPDDGDDSSDK